MTDGQPMKTAPDDGTPILVYQHPNYFVAWHENNSVWQKGWVFDLNRSDTVELFPTRWWPLPFKATITKQQTRIAKLEAALEPFEKAAGDIDPKWPDKTEIWPFYSGYRVVNPVTVGHLRNAFKIMEKKQ